MESPMTADLGPDPLAPWVREIATAHDAARHVDGVQCRGSVALIDEAARLRGVAQVKLGKAVSLEREVETRPARVAAGREAAEAEKRDWQRLGVAELSQGHRDVQLEVHIGVRGRHAHGGDVITYDAHGVHNTHMDGLSHLGADASWHGPIPAEASQTDEDTMVNWAQHGIVTRGVLLDVAAARGVAWITAEEPVTAVELDTALAAAGVTLEPGDALIIYGEDGAKWIASKDPGLVLWDFHDARNNPAGSLEVHNLIYAIGLCLVDNCLLGPAAATMKAAGTSTGLLVAAPTAIHRSTGVLINPLLVY
jgi:Putative cyclase